MDFPTTKGWVDVRDGLPDSGEPVLVASVDATRGKFEDVNSGHVNPDGSWVFSSAWFNSARRVIAWRPRLMSITQQELDEARAQRLSAEAVFSDQFGV